MTYENIKVPADGEKISMGSDGHLNVPDNPIISFIEGDGIGPDIWSASQKVMNAALEKAYGGKKKIAWMEVFAGEKSWKMHNESPDGWLPQETLDAINEYLIAIKGPVAKPVGSEMGSISLALQQKFDLYACLKPVKYFEGLPAPLKKPEKIDMVIFRENTEDVYAGIDYASGSPEAEKIKELLIELGTISKVRFPESSSFGIKPISKEATYRLVRSAIQYAIDNNRDSVTLVHKGNIMKLTDGYFMKWGYEVAKTEFGAKGFDVGLWCTMKNPKNGKTITIKDIEVDTFLRQILTRPAEYSVIATMNLTGDWISSILSAGVGGIGIAPGANINYTTGQAIFEATQGTFPKYAGQDKVSPVFLILSGEMMFRYLNWFEAADLIIKGVEKTFAAKTVTYEFARLIDGAKEVKCSELGNEIIKKMN